jgi:ribosomal protein S18 acetylase RimI-like enzyme
VRLADDSVVPVLDELRSWVDSVADNPSVATIRTAAMFRRAADRFEEAGFEVADRLVLLRADLTASAVRDAMRPREMWLARRATSTLRRRHFAAASRIDIAAFGAEWGHDAADLDEISRATPVARARRRTESPSRAPLRRPRGDLVAFAIAGASGAHGYLQRLAVAPEAQRRGHGRALTIDALRWMARRRLPDCLVNTSVDNVAARRLYESTGFATTADELTVLSLDVRSRR